jgi:Tfp pilus assembly protein PilP
LALGLGLGWPGIAFAQSPTVPAPAPLIGVPAVTAPSAPTYARRGRRDPFESIEALHPDMTAPTVASAKLRGILRGAELRALVETSDGLGYILKVGDAVGDGRLVQIGTDRVVFVLPGRQGTTVSIVLRLSDD